MPDEIPTITGAAALQAVFEGYFQAVHLHPEQLDLDRIDAHDDYAVVESHSVETVTNLADHTSTTAAFRELFVLVDTGEGWHIREYMFNAPHPRHSRGAGLIPLTIT